MKKIKLCLFTVMLMMSVSALTACGGKSNTSDNGSQSSVQQSSSAGGSGESSGQNQTSGGSDNSNSAGGTNNGTGNGSNGGGTGSKNGGTSNNGNDTENESSTGVIDGLIDDAESGADDMMDGTKGESNAADESSQ